MSTHRTSQDAGWVQYPSTLPKGPNGRALCRRCGQEVPKGRRTFCGDECVHEHRLRSDPGYLRDAVFKRDQGVCAVCGVDTKELRRRLNAEWKSLKTPADSKAFRERYPWFYGRDSYWDADHIVPVVEGGGECGLDNIRTLCIPCHQKVTAELAARRAAQRRDEAQQAREAELAAAGKVRLF